MDKVLIAVYVGIAAIAGTMYHNAQTERQNFREQLAVVNAEFHAAREERQQARKPAVPICGTPDAKGADSCITPLAYTKMRRGF